MIEAHDITRWFGQHLVLDHVSFEVASGSYAVLVGASGSGKSTLLRAIAGLIEIDSGSITLNDIDLTPLPPHLRPVSTVFQDYALFPHMTVAANIAFGLEQQGQAGSEIRKRVGAMLEIVGLPGMERRMPTSLSGGQQQRVALARALAVRPQLVLLDEPLGALDAELRQQMRRELHRIQRESGVTFLHISHDREEALSLADQLLVLQEGRLIGDGSPAVLRQAPGNIQVAKVLGLDNALLDPADTRSVLVFAPEHVVLGEGRWSGRIERMHELGGVIEREIITADGDLVRQRSLAGAPEAHELHDEVRFDLAPAHVRRVTVDGERGS
ncbi:MAG: ABC transporter ATP-binding protein [Thermomicrobiales bacterium]|nr:ABC transporter ATP-binding protein [Thermomicrobiales bacterium]